MDDTYSLLCIDDEKNILRSLNRVLRKGKFKVFMAESGQEGLEILKQEDIALILCDQRMPGMNGYEVLREAKKIKPDTIRIMLSGHSDFESLVKTINEGEVYRYFVKPWNSDLLIESIHEALKQREKMMKLNNLLASSQIFTNAIKDIKIEQNYEQMTDVINVELTDDSFDPPAITGIVNHLFEVLGLNETLVQGMNWIVKDKASLKFEYSFEEDVKIIINIKASQTK
jgi:DNA-binding NtrC family response regulator